MTVYLDASVLVSMFVADANTPRAWRLAELHPSAICSLWTVAEFSSALGLRNRVGGLAQEERMQAEALLDQWLAAGHDPVHPTSDDFAAARRMLRETTANLRTPDALHLAICVRLGADLASFDNRMLEAAAGLSITTIEV